VAIRQPGRHSHGELAALRRQSGGIHRQVRTSDDGARRFLIVEYDTDESSRWVPYPVSMKKLTSLFTDAGYSSITMLRSRPSVYRRAALYAALVTSSPA
jgi:hypothetical protein